jgi:hypothetical protein
MALLDVEEEGEIHDEGYYANSDMNSNNQYENNLQLTPSDDVGNRYSNVNEDQARREQDAIDKDKILENEEEIKDGSENEENSENNDEYIEVGGDNKTPSSLANKNISGSSEAEEDSCIPSSEVPPPHVNDPNYIPPQSLYVGTTLQSLVYLDISSNGCGPLSCSALYHLLIAPSVKLKTVFCYCIIIIIIIIIII